MWLYATRVPILLLPLFFFERSLATFSTAFIIDLQGRQSELGMEYDGRDTGADKTEVCAGCSR